MGLNKYWFRKVFTKFLQVFYRALAKLPQYVYKFFFTFSEGVWRAFEIRLLGMHKLPQSF